MSNPKVQNSNISPKFARDVLSLDQLRASHTVKTSPSHFLNRKRFQCKHTHWPYFVFLLLTFKKTNLSSACLLLAKLSHNNKHLHTFPSVSYLSTHARNVTHTCSECTPSSLTHTHAQLHVVVQRGLIFFHHFRLLRNRTFHPENHFFP